MLNCLRVGGGGDAPHNSTAAYVLVKGKQSVGHGWSQQACKDAAKDRLDDRLYRPAAFLVRVLCRHGFLLAAVEPSVC
jgi:hypothetical protein